ncbi:hypothetical protein EDB81DRAFT_755064 [Dactylonectria macrodidyma]|uniref:Zn(2)-C6 fungal-type domain-containing protein n=1 Tax=Dactylonectria macrodidyma TaxID=307937 RepID=A0A9P9FPQ1_9HYPO|nr:hypothetical protein EDB81DRAFT_755064 [Dactylonectria macrodidyma]
MANDKARPSAESGIDRRRRAPHKKVRTGCKTCKVRCDEGKPDCSRCVSTGRKCDGYAPSVDLPIKDSNVRQYQPGADSKLVLPRKSLAEIRSYQFFIEVTVPAIATTFDAEFWRFELPRICQSDPAIWHAVVSLGCVHERYLSRAPEHTENAFAMQQFNASVRCLAAPTYTDRWRALAISTIFICACHLEGRSDQARMHLKSGRKLLEEIRQEEAQQTQKCPVGPPPNSSASTKPISLSLISSILTGFQISDQALDQGGISNFPTLVSDHDSFTTWRYYTAPSKPPYLTAENLTRASRAAESLINGLTFFMQKHADEIKNLFLGKGDADLVESIASKQQPETRCFTEISKATRLFNREKESSRKGPRDVAEGLLQRTLLSLTLYHETSRLLLLKDPDEPDKLKRCAGLPAASVRILSLAEELLELNQDRDDKAFVPSSATSTPLFILAHSGFTQEIRRRAIELLKRPQMVGMWDSVMTAKLGEVIMEREESAQYDDRFSKMEKGTPVPERNDELPVDPLHRIFSMTFNKTGRRTAAVSMRTWKEWMQGEPGRKLTLEW